MSEFIKTARWHEEEADVPTAEAEDNGFRVGKRLVFQVSLGVKSARIGAVLEY